jgi:ribokinase
MWPFNTKKKQVVGFLAVGDVFIDTFIELEDAHVHCDINSSDCTISMKWGDKIPYKNEWPIAGVGNAGNAAVAAARLGLGSSLLATTGNDDDAQKIKHVYDQEGVSHVFLETSTSLPTNNAYVLLFNAERTILVKQFEYPYVLPTVKLEQNKPSWIYFTSICTGTEKFHDDFAEWITKNPDVKLAFQPGTFQMKLGTEVLKNIYAASTAFFCNKEEAQRILNKPTADFPELHAGIRALGPKIIIITDGPNGLTASNENGVGYKLPMYPDPKAPIDRTGAGDACSSTIIAAFELGIPFEQALLWGPINSMSVVQYIGAQAGLLSREKIEEYLKSAPADYKLTQIF